MRSNMSTQTITLDRKEYKELKEKAELGDTLLLKLVKGLEDIKFGRTKPWKRTTSAQFFFLFLLYNVELNA